MNWRKLFPNKEAFIVFVLYIVLFVFQGKLISKLKNEMINNTTSQ